MKPRDHRLVGQVQCPITNREIIRARAVTAELKLNIEKAQKTQAYGSRTHAYGKEFDVDNRLTLEEIHWQVSQLD